MDLKMLIAKLEKWSNDMDRERWHGAEYDCDMVELCDLIRDGVKHLRDIQYPPVFIIPNEGLDIDALYRNANWPGYIRYGSDEPTHR